MAARQANAYLTSGSKTRTPFMVAAIAVLSSLLLALSSYLVHPGVPLGIVALLCILWLSFVNVRAGLVLLLIFGAFSNVISILVSVGNFGGRALGMGALLRDLIFFAVLTGWLTRLMIARKKMYLPVKYPLVYMAVILAFVVVAPSRMTALLEFRNAAFYILIAYVAAGAFNSKGQIKTTLTVMGLLGIFVALFGIMQPITNAAILERLGFYEEMTGFGQHIVCHYPYPWPPWPSFARATAAIDTPIVFGMYMVLHLFILNAARCFYRGEILRKFFLLGLFLMAIAIALSLSRTAWYSFLASLITMGILTKRYRLVLLSMFVILTVFVIAQFKLSESMTDRFFSRSEIEKGSDRERIEDIKSTFKALRGNFALGVGLGSQGSAKTRFSTAYKEAGVYEIATDNYYLQMICEMGIVGLTAYLVLLALLLRNGIRIYRRAQDPQLRQLAAAIFMSILAVCFANAASSVFSSRIFIHYFWFLVGILFAIQKIDRTTKIYV